MRRFAIVALATLLGVTGVFGAKSRTSCPTQRLPQ